MNDRVILHIGLGSFHRAHQAVYLNRLRQTGSLSWSIAAGNIRSDMEDVVTALSAQHCGYTLETVSTSGQFTYERIDSISEVIPFEPNLSRLIEIGADGRTRIVSFTVTEAGYYLDGNGKLDPSQEQLAADIRDGGKRTIYGVIGAVLAERKRRSGPPITLLCCDNLRSNGARFRAGMTEFLRLRNDVCLLVWFQQNTSCPSNMVDRITPRPTPELIDRVALATGQQDHAAVGSERFIQWVIEDDFIADRPEWERVGAELVASVHAYEEAKIRILNATHGCVSWAGALLGLNYIHEDMAVPVIHKMAYDYITDDVIPCLDQPDHPSPINLPIYRDIVLDRFSNPFVRDTNERVAADGFTKISAFILPTLRERLIRGESIRGVARLPALLLAVLENWHADKLNIPYRDQVMTPATLSGICTAPDPLVAFVNEPILWQNLAGNEQLHGALAQARRELPELLGIA